MYLCLSSDVAPGCWREVYLLDGSYLVARDERGHSCDRNACVHRGFPMGQGAGKLPLRCGYHGLPFVPTQRAAEAHGAIWSAPPPELTPLEAAFLRLSTEGTPFQTEVMRVSAPWWLWIQNTMDPNHVERVHPDFAKQFETTKPHAVRIGENTAASSYRIPVREDIAKRWGDLTGISGRDFFHLFVWPNLSVTSFLGVLGSVETAVPAPGGGTMVTTRYFSAPNADIPFSVLEAAKKANVKLLNEDRAVCERWAKGRQGGPYWLAGEERIAAFVERLEREKHP